MQRLAAAATISVNGSHVNMENNNDQLCIYVYTYIFTYGLGQGLLLQLQLLLYRSFSSIFQPHPCDHNMCCVSNAALKAKQRDYYVPVETGGEIYI